MVLTGIPAPLAERHSAVVKEGFFHVVLIGIRIRLPIDIIIDACYSIVTVYYHYCTSDLVI
jgi:hypothetical protein